MNEPERRIALLVDADNAPAAKIDLMLAEVARHGTANVRRAYGNGKNPHLKSWEAVLHTPAIRPIQQFADSAGKNASDERKLSDLVLATGLFEIRRDGQSVVLRRHEDPDGTAQQTAEVPGAVAAAGGATRKKAAKKAAVPVELPVAKKGQPKKAAGQDRSGR